MQMNCFDFQHFLLDFKESICMPPQNQGIQNYIKPCISSVSQTSEYPNTCIILGTHARTSIRDRSLRVYVLVRVSIAVMKHHDQKQLRKERIYVAYTSR